ncbi:alpha-glucosidase/alpha-galactosidase [Deinococcus misasensis]|uniref:alpha-glucosidase/alpha-galactosidase n=1 Tax=Deinococcus misasensis TaxID=392413 RepID=UPI00054D2967|nr:alpha-glucosidase/alpha-galactosidase [Deinococcus misasensis]
MTHKPVITFIGAGSTVFAKNLLTDILSFPELAHSEIRLYDINEERLKTSDGVAHRLAQTLGIQPRIVATLDRDQALDGADYAINMIQVGGYQPATVTDFEVPKKYGLRQTIADTLGIGGIMRALRTIPVFLEMARDMERLCPDVTHLNYVNPMVMNCWALNKATRIKTIGLCHSVQHTAQELASDLGIPVEEINYVAAGINHMAFYLKFERNGEDLYPRLQEIARTGKMPEWNRVRYEMLTRLGYFVTESSEHFSEYVPYFIKSRNPELIERFNIPLDEYPRRCINQIAGWEDLRQQLEDPHRPLEVQRSVEYGSLIIHSLETGIPRVVYGNVQNDHLIDNLPLDCCVEVPVLVDRNGLQPTRIGKIPPQLAALMQTNINVQSLTVEAALTGNREHIYHAAMLDPHTSTELTLDEIWALVDDLLEAHRGWVPEGFLKSPVLG